MWAVLGTLSSDVLANVLWLRFNKRDELRKHSTSDEDYKRRVIEFYINTHPYPSWGHIAGRLLLWGDQGEALERARGHVVPDQG